MFPFYQPPLPPFLQWPLPTLSCQSSGWSLQAFWVAPVHCIKALTVQPVYTCHSLPCSDCVFAPTLLSFCSTARGTSLLIHSGWQSIPVFPHEYKMHLLKNHFTFFSATVYFSLHPTLLLSWEEKHCPTWPPCYTNYKSICIRAPAKCAKC